MARPKKIIDTHQVKNMAAIGCTMEEMASILKCSVDLLERRFADVIREGRDTGKMSLRRAMFKSAIEKGNIQAQIWLSKNWLGMRDRIEHSSDPEAPSKLVIDLSGIESNGQKKD
jgi:hypothetical protein